jgi:hypothetical protein
MIHAIGLLVKDRWNLTRQTLESIYYSDQPRGTYDLYIIDNGSDEQASEELKSYAHSGLIRVKNLLRIPPCPIPVAWNLYFLLTAHYSFRTKVDNDVILHNTLRPPPVKLPPNTPTPDEADPAAGSPRSVSIIKGMGQIRKASRFAANKIQSHSAFLQHMEEFGIEHNVGMVGLVSVPPSRSFSEMFKININRQHENRPFIRSGCIQIAKNTFQKVGYLDERLTRFCFRDYSQRAIRAKINIGYHPYYGLLHAGETTPTLKFVESDGETSVKNCASTQWLEHESVIKNMCEKHTIVTLG